MLQDSPMPNSSEGPPQSSPISIMLNEKTQHLVAQPYSLNQLTEALIKEASELLLSGYTYTNKNNLSIPVSIVNSLIEELSSEILHYETNQDIENMDESERQFRVLLNVNSLRVIINSTFKYNDENEENQLIELVYMLYGFQLNRLNNKFLEVPPTLSELTYVIVLTWMVMFRMNKDHKINSVCPEILRFLHQSLEYLGQMLTSGKTSQKNLKKNKKGIKIMRVKQVGSGQQQLISSVVADRKQEKTQNIEKEVLLDKYNFSKKKNFLKTTPAQAKSLFPMTITELLALYFKFNSSEITEQHYTKIIIYWLIQTYETLIEQSKKIGIPSRALYSIQISSHSIKQNLQRIENELIQENYTQSKNIYLKEHLSNEDRDYESAECQWEQLQINSATHIARILRKFQKYSKVHPEEIKMADEDEESAEAVKEDTIKVRQLTPRMYNDEEQGKLKALRQKKKKLKKKIESDIRRSTFNYVQEEKVLQDVRIEKRKKSEKKQGFILQKQTEEAKKFHNKVKKIKKMEKEAKGKGKGKGKGKK